MKKTLSIIVAAAILLGSSALFVFARPECDCGIAPLIVVSGFATVPLSLDGEQVFAPPVDRILRGVAGVLPPLIKAGLTKDWDEFIDSAAPALIDVFEPILCDKNGDSIHSVSMQPFPLSIDNYPDFYNGDDVDEQAFVKTAMETIGGDHVYFFNYDWRLDPIDNARKLKDFADNVKSETNHSRLTLAGCSMGGTVIMSYLKLFGSSGIQNFLLDNAAFQGVALVGDLLALDLEFEGEIAVRYTHQFVQNDLLAWFLRATGLFDAVIPLVETLYEGTRGRLGAEVLYPIFAHMPGMWSLVGHEQYERAKAAALDSEINAELIKKLDFYHYEVQQNAENLLKKAKKNGTNIMLTSNRGYYGIPITPSRYNNNDILIDTVNSSGGAVCAPLGQPFADDYIQAVKCGHNHISPDRMIDASTCMFPEYTWFVNGMKHLDYPYGSEAAEFLMWLIQAGKGEQRNIFSNEKYPQFMQFDYGSGKLTPMAYADGGVFLEVINPATGGC
ncbi:MAG: hypothetical protein FWF05_02160 [Oscillospiraceae bacterium]|nr:hypothetical protein [Oscillospiraceae bacterium]